MKLLVDLHVELRIFAVLKMHFSFKNYILKNMINRDALDRDVSTAPDSYRMAATSHCAYRCEKFRDTLLSLQARA